MMCGCGTGKGKILDIGKLEEGLSDSGKQHLWIFDRGVFKDVFGVGRV
jgi:hypothetical protein